MEQKNKNIIDYAIAKIVMMHGIILSYGGIPMIYAGDEIGTLNDFTYEQVEEHLNDNRWVNRPMQNWNMVSTLDKTKDSPSSTIYKSLKNMIGIRKEYSVFKDSNDLKKYMVVPILIFSFISEAMVKKVFGYYLKFNEVTETLSICWLLSLGIHIGKNSIGLLTGKSLELIHNKLPLKPFQQLWVTNG